MPLLNYLNLFNRACPSSENSVKILHETINSLDQVHRHYVFRGLHLSIGQNACFRRIARQTSSYQVYDVERKPLDSPV